MSRGQRAWALVVSAVVVLLVALPGIRMLVEDEAPDGFPLSTYPMFSRDPGRVVVLPTVVALAPDGAVGRLSPQTIAGTDQVIQASVTVRDAVRRGTAAAEQLCEEVAGRVSPPATIAVVEERHDAIRWSADSSVEPLERRVVVTCEAAS